MKTNHPLQSLHDKPGFKRENILHLALVITVVFASLIFLIEVV